MDGHLKAWRTNRLLAYLYGAGWLALIGYLYFSERGLPPQTVFSLITGLPVLCGLHAMAARSSRRRHPWARIFSLVMGAMLLVVFPVGTLFGAFLLMASWRTWPDPRAHAGAPRGGWPQDATVDRRKGGDRRGHRGRP